MPSVGHPREYLLVLHILKFPEVLERVVDQLLPHFVSGPYPSSPCVRARYFLATRFSHSLEEFARINCNEISRATFENRINLILEWRKLVSLLAWCSQVSLPRWV